MVIVVGGALRRVHATPFELVYALDYRATIVDNAEVVTTQAYSAACAQLIAADPANFMTLDNLHTEFLQRFKQRCVSNGGEFVPRTTSTNNVPDPENACVRVPTPPAPVALSS